jgi:peptidoglycan hydrolase CwlO-like protein
METILTVLITLGVAALIYAVRGVVKLSTRVDDLELVRMEIIDLEEEFEKQIENEIRDRERAHEDIYKRISEQDSSIDRRTDKLWEEYHNLNNRVKEINNK